jgi:serine protease Do
VIARCNPTHVAGLALLLCIATCMDVASRAAMADDLAAQQQLVFRHALDVITPSIVRIDTMGGAMPVERQRDGAARPAFRRGEGPTTGVIISPDGYILTSSFNFAHDPPIITVSLHDGRKRVAKLLARDHPARLALLKVDADDLRPAQWCDQSQVHCGIWSIAAGFGYGSDAPAVSVGIVSGLDRMRGMAIQTDARISPANYGGPLFDIDGKLLGVCVPMGMGNSEFAGVEWYDSGIGFAIPHQRVALFLDRLKSGDDVQAGYMGLMLASVEGSPGLRVMQDPVGPALTAGIIKDDCITHINGRKVATMLDVRRNMARHAAGDTVEITFVRDGSEQVVKLLLATQDQMGDRPPALPVPGVKPPGEPD